jgi:protein-tyrosine phosphatase
MNILLVCTANVCRSPAAEFLLASHLGSAARDISIRSAGVNASAGAPIDDTIGNLLRSRGVETRPFSSRQLTVRMLESADLVLTASTSHRSAVVQLLPTAVRRTLTLRQLARYAPFILESGEPPAGSAARLGWILAAVPQARALAPRDDDSIADPMGRSRGHYRAAVDAVDKACAAIAPLLGSRAEEVLQSPRSWWSEVSRFEIEGRSA